MAQITMDSKEYLELVGKAQQLDHLMEDLKEGITIEVDESCSYQPITIKCPAIYPESIDKYIAMEAMKYAVNSEKTMCYLVDANEHYFDKVERRFVRLWNDEKHANHIDCLKYAEFNKAWKAAKDLLDDMHGDSNEELKDEE